MSYRPSPKYASKNPRLGPWATCDRCSMLDNLSRMQFQYDYLGGMTPQNKHILLCKRCLDQLAFQRKLIVLPPDPPPVFNTRPENYFVDETNFLATETSPTNIQAANQYVTTGGTNYISSVPNPANTAIAYFSFSGNYSLVSIGSTVIDRFSAEVLDRSNEEIDIRSPVTGVTFYLDLFNGNPANSGAISSLKAITGSATRTNIGPQLSIAGGIASNTQVVTVANSSPSTVNVNYVGFYDAPTGGNLLFSGPTKIVAPSIASSVFPGIGVAFNTLDISINLN